VLGAMALTRTLSRDISDRLIECICVNGGVLPELVERRERESDIADGKIGTVGCSRRKRRWLRLHEKGSKRHEVPCHPSLKVYLDLDQGDRYSGGKEEAAVSVRTQR
jgi:hypothetical protein